MSFGVDAVTGSPEILIVEDSPTQALELKLTLANHGLRAAIVGSGMEALAWLQSRKAVMIISDIVMPGLDGYELCRSIRRDEKLRDIPVILLSYLSDVSDVLRGLESGASNFILKPYDADHLISYIRKELLRKPNRGDQQLLQSVPLEYGGRKYLITADVRQILDVLLATYGTAVQKNEDLTRAETQLRLLNENLEEKVMERTAELTAEVADRQRAEEELRRTTLELKAYSAKLERSNQELQDFAFIASHDLQEPLRKIQTFADRIVLKYNNSLDAQGQDFLFRMQRTAKRMSNLVRGALEYARATKQVDHFDSVDLRSSIQDVILDLKLLIEETGAVIELGNMLTIEGEGGLLRQLFQNLIGNALKFRHTERPPVIRIKCEHCVETSASGEVFKSDFCRISIEDNGIGFEEIYLNRIFKAFQRLHSGDLYSGTGVGLAICQKIVDFHNGDLTARSTPGKGSCFIVTLPVRQTDTRNSSDSERAQSNLAD